MKTGNRRDFLKKSALVSSSLLMTPHLINGCSNDKVEKEPAINELLSDNFIVPTKSGLPITGTFLDEISHDIPHQNWGLKEWDLDFQHMKRIGIDTVIMIRSGYRNPSGRKHSCP